MRMMIICRQGRIIVSISLERYRQNANYTVRDEPMKLDDRLWTVHAIGKGVNNFDCTFPVKVGSKVLVDNNYNAAGRIATDDTVYCIVEPGQIIALSCA